MTESTVDFETAFEALPGSFLILQPNIPHYTILAISDELLRITARERQQVVGKSIFEVYPENPGATTATGPSNLRTSLELVVQYKKPDQMPVVRYDVPGADGVFEARYWSANSKPVLDETGEVLYIITHTVDVTDQIKAEKRGSALRKIEKTYALFMQAPMAVCIVTGPENVVELANEGFLRLLGRTPDIIGKPLFESLPEAKTQGFPELLDQVRKTGEPFYATEFPATLHIHGKEELRYYNFVYQPYYENPGDTVAAGVFSVAHEVTEQVLARKQIEESEARFRSLAQNSPDVITRHGKDYKYLYASPRIEKYTGIPAADFPGKSYRELGLPEALCALFDAHLAYVFQNQTLHTLEYAMPNDKGYIHSRMVPECNEAGEVVSVLVLSTDIWERKRAEEALRQLSGQLLAANAEIGAANKELAAANDQLKRTNADLDNFIYTASHDLKAPIMNIEGLLQALLRALPPESLVSNRAQRIVSLMHESVERFKKTIVNLTEVVKLQKEHNGEAAPVDFLEVVGEVMLDLEPMIQSSGAQIKVDVADYPAIRFSEKNLRSLIYNLLSNGIKYCSPERMPRVRISFESTPEYHILTITDNGLGIEPEGVEQLFTMFKRFHDHVEGSGIGLYMVKKMVDNAGGKIEVESQAGQGTTFKVYIPR